MSNYGRGKRRYNPNGYNNGYHRRGRYNKNMDHYNNAQHFNGQITNDNGNKPFRILQRKQVNDPNTTTNNNNIDNINTNNNTNAPLHSPTHQPHPTTNTNININTHNNALSRFPNLSNPNDNVAAVLQNVISDPSNLSASSIAYIPPKNSLGHQLLGMQKRGGRLYHYKRKDGTGAVIPIPQHHKKNYNKSIGRGKKFDKEREAALQALAQQNNDGTDDTATTVPSDNNASEPHIAIGSETANIIADIGASTASTSNNTAAATTVPAAVSATPAVLQMPEEANTSHEDTRSWRRGNSHSHSDRAASFRTRGRGGGRGRGRGRGRVRRGKHHYKHYNRHRSNFASDKWSDEEDYNRDRGFRRWDKRPNKFEPPRHRNHEWDKHHSHSHSHDKHGFASSARKHDDTAIHSPNMGPRHRHYNQKFNTHRDGSSVKWDAHISHTEEDVLSDDSLSNIDLENEILNRYVNCYDNNSRQRRCQSVPFLDVRMCPHVLNEIEEQLSAECSDFLVIGVIGQQGVGKSRLLSCLAGDGEDIFLTAELNKLISSTHCTHGIQGYASRSGPRVIYLDCQPILSPSILFSLTNHRRRCIRENADLLHSHSSAPMETWDIEMVKHALFLSCICHVLLVVSDTMFDVESTHFLRSIYAMRQSMKLNSFLRHDSSLRKRLKELQTEMNEKYDKKKADLAIKLKTARESKNIRPQWVKHAHSNCKERRKEVADCGLGEEEALFYGIDASVGADYKLFKLLNAQQRYGFPDVVFVQNKVCSTDMTPATFGLQRRFLYTMFKHEYLSNEGEIGNVELLGMQMEQRENSAMLRIPAEVKCEDEEVGSGGKEKEKEEEDEEQCVRGMASKMNLFFLPRVQSNKLQFENGCRELRNQIICMGKPQTISQSHSYKQTERDWFSFSKKIWNILTNAPNFIEYRGNQNHNT